VQDMQTRLDHAREPESASNLARTEGKGRLSYLWQDFWPEERFGSSFEDPSGYPAILLSSLQQDFS